MILGRKTRSGREFKDLPPPPRRKSVGEKPKQEPSQRKERPRPKPTRKAKKPEAPTGEKSKQQSAWQEAQRRAANGGDTDGAGTSAAAVERSIEMPAHDETAEEKAVEQELAAEKSMERQPSVEDTDGELSVAAIFAIVGQSLPDEETPPPSPPLPSPARAAKKSVPQKSSKPESKSPAPSAPVVSSTSPAPSAPVLKLTRSDTVITATAGRPNDPSGKDLAHRKAAITPKSGGSKPSGVATDARDRGSHTTKQPSKSSSSASKDSAGTEDSSQVPTPKSAVPAGRSGLIVSKSTTAAANKSPTNETPSSGERPSVLITRAPAAIKDKTISLKAARKSGLIISGRSDKDAPSSQSAVRRFDAASGLRISQVKKPQAKPTTSGADSTGEPAAASSSKPDETSSTHKKPVIVAGTSGSKPALAKPSFPMMKRKEPPEQLLGVDAKKRKLVRKFIADSSDESSEPRSREEFNVNPFDRRAKRTELMRKGVKGEALDVEMRKWYDSKRSEWKQREKEKSSGEGEKSGSDARSGGARTIGETVRSSKAGESGSGSADQAASKSVKGAKESFNFLQLGYKAKEASNASRDQSKPVKDSSQPDNLTTSPKIRPTSSQLVWNRDWGMDVAKVSVSGLGDDKSKFGKKLLFPRRESDARREGESGERKLKEHTTTNGSSGTLGPSVSLASRAPKPKPRVQL